MVDYGVREKHKGLWHNVVVARKITTDPQLIYKSPFPVVFT